MWKPFEVRVSEHSLLLQHTAARWGLPGEAYRRLSQAEGVLSYGAKCDCELESGIKGATV